MKFEKKAVIFDRDGVICFTDRFHYQAWKALADRLGIYFDEKINDRLRGVSRMASLDIILERSDKAYTQEEKEAFATEKNDTYRELLKNMGPDDLTDEVKDTLVELRNRGYKLSIGSSSKNTKFILGQIGLGDFFDAIADGTDITHSKPDPEVFLISAKKIGIDPADCAVVEDAKSGIEAAKAAGMTALALFGDAKGCGLEDYDLTSFSDLLNILLCMETVDAAKWRRECADKAVTLVKDLQPNALPMTPERYPDIRLITLGKDDILDGSVAELVQEYLEEQGFRVERYDPMADDLHGTKGLRPDRLTLYISNYEQASNQTVVRINWCPKHALDMPRFVQDEVSVFVSLANPYHLQDVPRIKTYINAYTATKDKIQLTIDKLMGRSQFCGVSPVDPFCGLPDTHL